MASDGVKPAEIMPLAHDRRRYPRCGCSADARLRVARGFEPAIPVTVVNYSETGLALRAPKRVLLPVGSTVRLTSACREFFSGHSLRGELVRSEFNGAEAVYGVRFHKLLGEQRSRGVNWGRKLSASLLIVLLALLIPYLKTRNIISFWYAPLWQAYSMIAAIYIVTRIGLSMAYREPRDYGVIKSLSVVLPVKNEEAHIEEVVRRCFQASYPADKLELIVVDDGSTDRTWEVLRRLAPRYPNLTIHKFERNQGKRHGMAWGIRHSRSEIVVFMDSDSLLEPEALYRLIQPFRDERVGAVAGHTDIIVEPKNTISKIETVRYFVSQRVMKAAESVFGAVTCCPGPLSAYRREAILQILDGWLNQKFLGAAATFGDDRSLTNRILRNYRVVYHAGARCGTFAPDTWRTFLKQQLRWKKSWARETLSACIHMWREHPVAALSYYMSVVITLASPFVVLRAFVWSPIALGTIACTPYIVGLMLVFLLLGAIYYYHTQSRYWYYGLIFAAIYSWIFSLQTYYAILTVRENHWGTR